jgi:hypothetical protein
MKTPFLSFFIWIVYHPAGGKSTGETSKPFSIYKMHGLSYDNDYKSIPFLKSLLFFINSILPGGNERWNLITRKQIGSFSDGIIHLLQLGIPAGTPIYT